MPNDWQPAPEDIETATTLLTRWLPHSLEVAGKKRQEIKDIYAISALSKALSFCLPVLPPEVAALAQQHYQAILDAYKTPSHTNYETLSYTNERPSVQLEPEQKSRF